MILVTCGNRVFDPRQDQRNRSLCHLARERTVTLNAKTKEFAYPMPDVQERLERLKSLDHAAVIDVADAFLTVPLCEVDAPKTAF